MCSEVRWGGVGGGEELDAFWVVVLAVLTFRKDKLTLVNQLLTSLVLIAFLIKQRKVYHSKKVEM